MPDIPIELMWLACCGGCCYFCSCLVDMVKPLVYRIVRKVSKKKNAKPTTTFDTIESISTNLSAEIEKFLNQVGKEEV